MNRLDRVSLFETLKNELCDYCATDIENGIMYYALNAFGRAADNYDNEKSILISEILKTYDLPTDIETIIEFFETLLDVDTKVENGIVFTPKYISDYIVSSVVEINPWDETKYFIDPSCGGGIFLVSVAETLHDRCGIDIDTIIEKYIFGIDIEEDNVRRCTLALRLLSAKHGGNYRNINCNIHCCDSLKTTWASEFGIDKFTYIIGNPPYINPHDMSQETINFLKSSFLTTKTGVFNIFYAFIEHAMENLASDGVLGYIVPNNFLTIKSAHDLRAWLQTQSLLYKILDLGDNMVFKPVRTYNCILVLTKEKRSKFDYFVMAKSKNIKSSLYNITFNTMDTEHLDVNRWNLVDEHTRCNLDKIENNLFPLKPFIRTGIATLKDSVFMVDRDEDGYFKLVDSEKVYIEDGLVKPIYKIPDLKLYANIKEAERHIIFPYIRAKQGYALISEDDFLTQYPLTYKALMAYKSDLDTRDKGRPNPQGWYAYGRTQGLNKYGRKLLFPTFANRPKFIYVENKDALFCNGYGIFENERYELDVLSKILNSAVMSYYISNTSYSIEGGYYCYQKKYIERFSIPLLSEEQKRDIKKLSGNPLDHYLWNLYDLD